MANKEKTIKQSEINTFKRIGFDYQKYDGQIRTVRIANRFSGETVDTLPIVADLIEWVYGAGERGVENRTVRVDDFDRVRYFVMRQDSKAYMTCLD